MNWREQIEAQIVWLKGFQASIALSGDYGEAEKVRAVEMSLRKALDAAIAADDYMTYGPLNAEFGGDIAHNRLSHALDKLKEAAND